MSDLIVTFDVTFVKDATDLLKNNMSNGNIIDEVHEALNKTDYYMNRIKEDTQYIRDLRITKEVLRELKNTPSIDLEQFITSYPERVFCDAETHEAEGYADHEIVFAVPCEFDLGDFIRCDEKKNEAPAKREMTLDRAKELLGFFVDHECVGENTNTAIQKLFSVGMTEDEIQSFGFSAADIEYAKECEDEFER